MLLRLCVVLAVLAPACLHAAAGPREFDGAWRAKSQAGVTGPVASRDCAPGFIAGVGAASTAHIVMGRDVMVIVHEANHSARRIYINGQHPDNLQPSNLGHSIGWWEGDTLVVETVALKSGQTVVERIRKVNSDRALEVIVNGRAMLAESRPEYRYVEAVCESDAPVSGEATAVTIVAISTVSAPARPAFDGVWQISQPVRMLRSPDGSWPPLRSEARKLYEQRIDLFTAGKVGEFNGSNACIPPGEPRTAHGGQALDIVQGEHALFMGNAWPGYYGLWTGRWDGDALVLSGTGFRADFVLDAAGLPHSEALHLTQRLKLGKGGTELEIRTTIEDPKTYIRSWSTVQRFRKLKEAVMEESVCVPLRE
jgi:hypothetical protein